MKAISLHQPWASLVACGTKTIETRSWPAHKSVIGERIAIHAAKTREGKYNFLGRDLPLNFDDLPFGALVCTAVLDRCVKVNHIWRGCYEQSSPCVLCTVSEFPMSEQFPVDRYGDFNRGRWLWILKDIQPLDRPISTPGRQGFWELRAVTLRRLEGAAS
jgi:hypothetical protein